MEIGGMEVVPILPEVNPDAPDVYFENNVGTHYTLTAVTPIDFGTVEAGDSGELSDIYVDNEAVGTPANDLDDPIIDGVAHPTAQVGAAADTYDAMEYGPDGVNYYDPWRHDSANPIINPIPADGPAGTREQVYMRWSPPGAAAGGAKIWATEISGTYT
ncbi:unnamed protein product [marine sediment metagenome]|uniref:Uncharacterized protein n=1 Tax=marine sediment metagenome TaxID=412755 RepID=X1GGV4_9ZZZZ